MSLKQAGHSGAKDLHCAQKLWPQGARPQEGTERDSAYFSRVNVTSFTTPGSLPQSFLKHRPGHQAEGLIYKVRHSFLSKLTV